MDSHFRSGIQPVIFWLQNMEVIFRKYNTGTFTIFRLDKTPVFGIITMLILMQIYIYIYIYVYIYIYIYGSKIRNILIY